MNKIIKQLQGTTIVLGFYGDREFLRLWDNLIFNYNIGSEPIYWFEGFFYIKTQPERFIENFGLFLQNQMFMRRECKAGEYSKLAIQESKKFLKSLPHVRFYNGDG